MARERILLVDDDELFLSAMAQTLTQEGYEVSTATNGLAALTLAKSHPFDLIIMDVRMPEMDGVESVSEIKKLQPAVRSIMITGYTTEESEQRAQRIGVNAFFYKPLELPEFLRTVRQCVTLLQERQRHDTETRQVQEQYFALTKGLMLALVAGGSPEREERVQFRSTLLEALADAFHLPRAERHLLELAVLVADFPGVMESPPPDKNPHPPSTESHLLRVRHLLEENLLLEPLLPLLEWASPPQKPISPETPFLGRLLVTLQYCVDRAGSPPRGETLLATLEADHSPSVDPKIVEAIRGVLRAGGVAEAPPGGTLRARMLSLLTLAKFYQEAGNTAVALQAYQEVLTLLQSLPDDRALVTTHLGIARCRLREGNIAGAVEEGTRTLELASRSGFTQLEAHALLLLGDACLLQGDLESAREFFLPAQEIIERWREPDLLARLWLRRTFLFVTTGETRQALNSWSKALTYLESAPTPHVLLDDRDIFPRLISAMIETPGAIQQLFRIVRRLEERGYEFLRSATQALPDSQRGVVLRIIKEEFPRPVSAEKLRLFSFGAMRIYRGGSLIDEREWPTKKTKYLLLFLVANQSRHASDDLLMDTFWPNTPAEKARNNLYQTVHHLRRILEPNKKDPSKSLYVLRKGSRYSFNSKAPYWWDVDEFEATLARGEELVRRGETAAAIEELQRLDQVYQEDFLSENLEDEWASLLRDRLQQRYHGGMVMLAQSLLAQGRPAHAVERAQRVVEVDPYNDDAHVAIMEGYLAMDRPQDAARCYDRYRALLKRELKLSPSTRMEELYHRITAPHIS